MCEDCRSLGTVVVDHKLLCLDRAFTEQLVEGVEMTVQVPMLTSWVPLLESILIS
ncbi:hypothetical protein D3C71_2197900 [compost metagenome]